VDKHNIYLHGYLYKRVPVNSITYILGHIIAYETSYDIFNLTSNILFISFYLNKMEIICQRKKMINAKLRSF
jgi:hypothetical protein